MPVGTPINRQWIVVLKDGTPVIEWGVDLAVDLYNGSFVPYEGANFSHAIQDAELETLKMAGRIAAYDDRQVYIYSLPEPPASDLSE